MSIAVDIKPSLAPRRYAPFQEDIVHALFFKDILQPLYLSPISIKDKQLFTRNLPAPALHELNQSVNGTIF